MAPYVGAPEIKARRLVLAVEYHGQIGNPGLDLKLMEKAGLICDLECQPKFPIHVVPQIALGDHAVVPGRVATYIADFSYFNVETNSVVVEDVKSKATRTALYRLKKKLIEAEHDITIAEV